MKINYKQLLEIIGKTKDEILLRQTLKYIFSFEYNIDVFSYFMFPDAITSTIPNFHYEIYKFLNDPNDGALVAPRGHGKSTVAGLVYLIWSIVNNKEKYIVYISSNHTKTVQFLDPIRDAFKFNDRLKSIYPITLKSVKSEEGKDREDCFDTMGCRVEAVSFEKNLRGFKYKFSRPTLIICDDIEIDERVSNPDLRLKDSFKLDKIIIPSLDPEVGRLKFIGTILHWDSLLIKKIRLYNGKIYRACDENFENILWEDYWTKERLIKKYKSIGSISFSSEFLNNPIENDSSIIKKKWLDKCKNENYSYNDFKDTVSYLGCDFAFGDRATNDNSVYSGVAPIGDKFLVNRMDWHKGLSLPEQFNIISDLHSLHKYKEIIMEENSIKSMSKDIYKYNLPYYLIWTGVNDPAEKKKGEIEFEGKRHTVGKKNMILRLATLIENEKIIFPYKTEDDKNKTNRFIDEALSFALNNGNLVEVGVHPDAPISLAMVMERIVEKPRLGYAF